MIFYHKKDREYFNYDTDSTEYYYLNKDVFGKSPWDWRPHVKDGAIFSIAPNVIGLWQDE